MGKDFIRKVLSTTISIVPLIFIVTVVFLIGLIPECSKLISVQDYWPFLVCAISLIYGSSMFQIGADSALSKVGSYVGAHVTKKGSIVFLICITFLVGLLVTIAEPDLSLFGGILSQNVFEKQMLIRLFIGIGVGSFLVLGLVRIIKQKGIKLFFIFTYFLIFAIAALYGPKDGGPILSISCDSSGVTTGPATVPFIIAFGAAVASSRGGKDVASDSFGLTGIMSLGPILMMILYCTIPGNYTSGLLLSIGEHGPEYYAWHCLLDVLMGISPLFLFFILYNLFFLKVEKTELLKILVGFAFTFVGLYVFLLACNIGFIPLGKNLGKNIANIEPLHPLFVLFGFTFGAIIVLAEPSIQILTTQVQEISGGVIKKRNMSLALAIGVGTAISLEICRIVFWGNFSSYYFYIPFLGAALVLALIVPDIYVAIAFDSGGVSSGTLSVSFILPFVIGAVTQLNTIKGTDYSGFGVIGMISLVPIITIETLGIFAGIKSQALQYRARKHVMVENDLQVIHFGVDND